jgi:uncharacterized Zn finger protein
MTRKRTKTDYLKNLTWDDLEQWAGNTIVSRGRNYQRNRRVKGLARTPHGGLIAWVEGTRSYATQVDLESGTLCSTCNCPYWDTCKHAVALVLEYLYCLKNGVVVPEVTAEDERLRMLAEYYEGEPLYSDDEDDLEDDAPLDRHRYGEPFLQSLQAFLRKQTKAQLSTLLEDLADRYPPVRDTLQDLIDLSTADISEMVRVVRAKILEISSEPGWADYWKGERFIPDYSPVKKRLEALEAEGHADEVITLGEELLEAGRGQVEMSNDEGETVEEISSCLEVVFRALPHSSLTPVERMLWVVEAEVKDEYGLCQGAEVFWGQKHRVEDWNILAETLMDRLKQFRGAKGEDRFSQNYRRERLSDWVILALKNAGRHDDVITLCVREAEKTGSYARLVDFLLEAKRWEEAEQWIHRGIEATQNEWPGIATRLRNTLRQIRENEGDWPGVAALRAEEFLLNPTFESFQKLGKAAEKAGVWPAVRTAAMNYLETGRLPEEDPSWPLPDSGIKEPGEPRRHQFPLIETLVEVAIAEGRPDEVIRWYDQDKSQKPRWGWSGFQEDRVAEAIVGHYPDRALGIWKSIAESEIARTKPEAYRVAGSYLRKARRVLKDLGREKEWHDYLAELRRVNARKRRLLEILDSMSGRRIID